MVTPYVRRAFLRLRGSDPPMLTFVKACHVGFDRTQVTIYGCYTIREPEDHKLAVIGEYWAEDGISMVELYQPGQEDAGARQS